MATPLPPGDAAGPTPAWMVLLPHEPGMSVLQVSAGPLVMAGVAIVASSSIGFVGVRVSDGEVLWRQRGEERPEAPEQHGELAWLIGQCIYLVPELPPPPERGVRGCVTIVEPKSGAIELRQWLEGDPPVPPMGLPTTAIELDGKTVRAADETLLVDERPVQLSGRFATVPGTLAPGPRPQTVIAVDQRGGIGPVIVDLSIASIVHAGDRVPAVQVLSAATGAAGDMALALRLDGSLMNDEVAYFDAKGALIWRWPLPRPQKPRLEPVGLALVPDGVVVFWEGNRLAKLPTVEGS